MVHVIANPNAQPGRGAAALSVVHIRDIGAACRKRGNRHIIVQKHLHQRRQLLVRKGMLPCFADPELRAVRHIHRRIERHAADAASLCRQFDVRRDFKLLRRDSLCLRRFGMLRDRLNLRRRHAGEKQGKR